MIGDAAGEVTVGGIAIEMGVTQPVASRTIAGCIADGLIRRAASQVDGRRTVVELTDAGEAERSRFAAEQREVFESITASWDLADRIRFAEYLIRYSHDASAWSSLRKSGGGSSHAHAGD
ncbi:MarR family winged helix-turn-helix transcriptional regulator [Nocardia sp. NPDC058705]|uniref:MarR family winged helix-turn-helix transcriptional regulator n=1 Tax=Nocardia sp. NPDC058705 TaxID=3346609 RepID=UPI0036810419